MGARGPKPGTVKKPASSGRKAGTLNKSTKDIKAIAQEHGAEAIGVLVTAIREADNWQAKISAAKELMDRGYGKATQPIAGDPDSSPVRVINEIVLRGVRSDSSH